MAIPAWPRPTIAASRSFAHFGGFAVYAVIARVGRPGVRRSDSTATTGEVEGDAEAGAPARGDGGDEEIGLLGRGSDQEGA